MYFFQLIMLLFEAFAVIHLGDMEARYKELTKYYELTNYIANEREDFSRLLHNDVLQDIGGAKNLLSLRSPDVDETKRILSDLELRVRNMRISIPLISFRGMLHGNISDICLTRLRSCTQRRIYL